MAGKKTKAPTDDELGELFEGIGDDSAPKRTSTGKTRPGASKARGDAPDDILAELENQLGNEPPARPHTPRVRDAKAASKRSSTETPPPRSSEDKPSRTRKSGESIRASFTPSATSSELQENEKKGPVEQTNAAPNPAPIIASGGGWFGGFVKTAMGAATAVVERAGKEYKELQQNEDARKNLVNQATGNLSALRGYIGEEWTHRGLPSLSNILNTLAPPISSHERLLIHITHDLVGYPSLDPLVYGVFSRVMSQVEGGDLLVIQRGRESHARRMSDTAFYRGSSSAPGWRDGPWWLQVDSPRSLGAVEDGLVVGTKLCRASAESYARDYFEASGGITEAQKRALEPMSETNPVRTSDIFLAVQAITVEADPALFVGSSAAEKAKEESAVADDTTDIHVCFAVYVLDPIHEIEYSTLSQCIPAKWLRWLDVPSPLTPPSSASSDAPYPEQLSIPEDIREIIESGAVDPREWVAEWVEEALSLSVGIVAQRYVARRMGVGEGGFAKGKQRMETLIAEGAGEAARAGLI